jgi:hypothetical protein
MMRGTQCSLLPCTAQLIVCGAMGSFEIVSQRPASLPACFL